MTRLRTSKTSPLFAVLALALVTTPLAAADEPKPVTDRTVTARDVGMTPIQDLNLEKDEIPPLLLAAQNDPYSTAGLKKCANYATAVKELDDVLGPDFDVATPAERKMTFGTVAKSVVGSFIPFRGVIREISGANKHAQDFQDAIVAGLMRRSFLKGQGLKLGCSYPARPADAKVRAKYAADLEKAQAEDARAKEDKKS
ncbi:MAG: hypothetical protein P0Y56_02660 [Candidatus Andeanibacterium colombiense]|uniref:Uncharacterized protein n=1 Tax=Candidatus Andeanibacterium colombiense TaxID=3121345 RepID=A0AAJ6BPI8_9SPHN|nr:MAG: hypothetical protein P0Y56_02660 [Sphingomonadaceae bacterium]